MQVYIYIFETYLHIPWEDKDFIRIPHNTNIWTWKSKLILFRTDNITRKWTWEYRKEHTRNPVYRWRTKASQANLWSSYISANLFFPQKWNLIFPQKREVIYCSSTILLLLRKHTWRYYCSSTILLLLRKHTWRYKSDHTIIVWTLIYHSLTF